MNINVWGSLLPLIVFLVSAGLAVVARARGWKSEEPSAALEQSPARAGEPRPFLERHRWRIILAAALAAILLFAVIFAPPRLGGEIPPDPNQPGRPFYSLHWSRVFLRDNFGAVAGWSNLAAGLLCFIPITLAIKHRSRLHAEAALLLGSLGLAMLAQWTLADQEIKGIGALLYMVAGLGYAYWAWMARGRLAQDLSTEGVSKSAAWELPVVLILLAVTAFGRFYALESVPYGIEGDEAKWTSEAVNLGILGESDTNGEYHRDALPVSFYLQTPFHRLFGASLLSARMSVAFLSVVASLLFYWLLRELAPIPVAGLATYLLSISIFDISASRLANVESFVKLWGILPLALLAFALKNKPWQAFALGGMTLALAILTYDTLWPMVGVCLVLALIELRKLPTPEKMKSLAALFGPSLLTLPVLIPYFNSRVSYYELGKKGWESGVPAKLGENFINILDSWFVILRPDFLFNRAGPLLNAALLPWLALGLVAGLFLLRAKSARWLLVWAGLVILPVPILTSSPLGRVYYPALPAIYGLTAIGLFLFWKELGRVLSPALRPVLIAVALIPLVWLPLFNYFIYFNEVSEPKDRQMRREISEIAATVTDEDTLLLLAVVPGADEPLNNEYQMIELFLLENLGSAQVKQAYQRVGLDEVMPAITGRYAEWKKLVIVLDKESPGMAEERAALTEGLVSCFPLGQLVEGRHFDRFILDETARKEPTCIPVQLSLSTEYSSRMRWELSAGSATSLSLWCERQKMNYHRLEAEEIPLGPGWQIQINFAPGWSGSGFLMDNHGSQFLSHELPALFSGNELYVWVRTYKRTSDHSPVYLTINGVTLPFADTAQSLLNQWIWERVGPFPNDGSIRITIARPYNESLHSFMAIFLDSLILSDEASLSPEASLTEPMPPQYFSVQTGARLGVFLPELPSGAYSCFAQVDSAQNLVDALGHQPVTSNTVEINIP